MEPRQCTANPEQMGIENLSFLPAGLIEGEPILVGPFFVTLLTLLCDGLL